MYQNRGALIVSVNAIIQNSLSGDLEWNLGRQVAERASSQETSWIQSSSYDDSISSFWRKKKKKKKCVYEINFLQVEGILQESRSVIRVLDQIQKEKTCEMDIRLRTLKQHL
jgi:hypothetical protein